MILYMITIKICKQAKRWSTYFESINKSDIQLEMIYQIIYCCSIRGEIEALYLRKSNPILGGVKRMSNAKVKLLGIHELVAVVVNSERNTVVLDGIEISANEIQLDNPITGTVFGTLLNYRGALDSLGETVNEKPYNAPPIAPILYIKPANTFNCNRGSIPMPKGLNRIRNWGITRARDWKASDTCK